ncbi:ATM1-like ABC transporter with 6 transmembrane domains [Cryptosporidium sp. chipmunk genotype I]|uniref:ATM1-like ABC transporter with 6 transmembrane domains n=1 Tax=Cryptosporidium sp. chipmunk genotype I TaxID=1280935 RepID=UPI00351A7B6D|nr:ATM1-like ABC transporter with 6 transmembrane domains [Cryptosporidium sp. chipmunk genotype I]
MWAFAQKSPNLKILKLHPLVLNRSSTYGIHCLGIFTPSLKRRRAFFFSDYKFSGSNCMHAKPLSTYKNKNLSKENVLLSILKKSRFIQEKDSKNIEILTKYLWPKNKEYKRRIIFSLLSLGVAKFATIQVPLLLSRLIDTVGIFSSSDLSLSLTNKLNVLFLISSYGIARISSSGFNELRNALFSEVSQSACKDLSLKAFHHFHNVSNLSFIQSHKSGELLTIITRGFKSVSKLLNIMIFQIIPTTAEFLMVLGILLHKVGSEVALITLATMVAYMDFTRRITHKRTIYRKNMNTSEQKSNGLLSDSLINAETLKYLNGEKHIYDLYSKYQEIYKNSNVKVQTSLAYLNFGQNFIFTGGLLSAMLLTTNKVLAGTLPIGSIVLVTSLLFQLAIPLNFIGMIYRESKLTLIDLSKLNEYLTIKPKNASNFQKGKNKLNSNIKILELYKEVIPKETDPSSEKNSIKLENVSFGFPSTFGNEHTYIETSDASEDLVLNDLSLEIPLGKRMGLVGSSGSGKTTLAKLIYRIFEPNSGKIRIFGKKIEDFELHEYRNCFAVLPQDVLLLNMSIIDNLKIANSKTTLDEIKSACKLAGIHENILKMKSGYETIVGERGCSLSGGEKQRLGFARMLIKKSPIWILDEPTSALDLINHNFMVKILSFLHGHSVSNSNSSNISDKDDLRFKYKDIFSLIPYVRDKKEIESITKLIDDIVKLPLTIIVIAHRLSSVRNFDSIAYLEEGSVKEVGNHEQLIENKMQYYQLWNKQHIDSILK